jgi:hypothetical protein
MRGRLLEEISIAIARESRSSSIRCPLPRARARARVCVCMPERTCVRSLGYPTRFRAQSRSVDAVGSWQ